jgi:hypothetical protein
MTFSSIPSRDARHHRGDCEDAPRLLQQNAALCSGRR